MDERAWNTLLDAIAKNTNIHTLHLEGDPHQENIWHLINENYKSVPHSVRTKGVADMLLVNRNIIAMPFDGNLFKHSMWTTIVQPMRLQDKKQIVVGSSNKSGIDPRAAVLARVLPAFEKEPVYAWKMLLENLGVSILSGDSSREAAAPRQCRKRVLSNSLDIATEEDGIISGKITLYRHIFFKNPQQLAWRYYLFVEERGAKLLDLSSTRNNPHTCKCYQ